MKQEFKIGQRFKSRNGNLTVVIIGYNLIVEGHRREYMYRMKWSSGINNNWSATGIRERLVSIPNPVTLPEELFTI